jgi:predicted secreted Zn-dependent protease
MKQIFLAACMIGLTALPSMAANVSKTYSYFTVGGTTLDQLEAELSTRGPKVKSTGRRHPGATQMEFTTKLGYAEKKGYCRVAEATVSVKAKIILPRWRQRGKAEQDVRLIWDTLSSDIKRHEESHVVIAKNHARELEQKLIALGRQKTCEDIAAKAKALAAQVLARHDKAQDRFDRVEGMNFERRILGLLRYRMERIEAGKLPG